MDQIAWAELKRQGIDPEAGGPYARFTGAPMLRVVAAVQQGKADAGVIRGCLLEHLERQGKIPAGQLRVLAPRTDLQHCRISSRLYPDWAFAAASATPATLSRDVLLALLTLPRASNGQTWSVPADYHPVRAMLRELEIGPYAFLRTTAWETLARRYWPAVALLLGVLVAWLIYTLRVEYLVNRRTQELSSALAEREQLEKRVRANQQQMDHLSRLSILGELSGTLAHELNQPLATIGNYAQRQTGGTPKPARPRPDFPLHSALGRPDCNHRTAIMTHSPATVPVIHVVDDDDAFRRSLLFLLESMGWEAVGHTSAEAFLAAAPQLSPAGGCLLLDIRMPRISGLELQRRLRHADSLFPVLFMTGHGDIELAVQAMKEGALDFLQKPFKDQAILDAVERAVASSRAQLSDDEAYDVAAYVVSQPRPAPKSLDLSKDFPARFNKPVDAAFPPYLDGVSADQHKYGPFPPLVEKMKALKEQMQAGKASK